MSALLATSNGAVETAFGSDAATFAELLDADGSAAMIHGGSDNYANVPTRYSTAGNPGPDATTLATRMSRNWRSRCLAKI